MPCPEARKLQSPQSSQAGLGVMDWAPGSACSIRGAETGRGGPAGLAVTGVPPLGLSRLRYRLHHCVRLPYSTSYGQGAETQKVLRIQNLSVGRGLLSTLPYCVPLMLPCAAAAWELCTPGPVLDLQ